MKTIYTSIIILLSSISYSQDIEIFKTGETQDISGTEIVVISQNNQNEMLQNFDVLNTSGNALNLKVVRVKLDEIAGGVNDYLTYSGSNPMSQIGYNPAFVSPQNPFTSEVVIYSTSLVIQALGVYYLPNGIIGTTKYRYYLLDNDTQARRDSVDVTFTYTTLSIGEEQNVDFSVYPNPASSLLNISISENNTSISIFNILGKNILELELTKGINTLNIVGVNTGVYFYSIKRNDTIIGTKKLIVK